MNALALGVVADDFTGATDVANTLAREGMRTVLTIGPPRAGLDYDDPRALVVALKTRSIPPEQAVARSLEALDALLALGARAVVFKYCSTFDSTDDGNIGPVADALSERLGAAVTLHCPAFPANGRRVFGGYLFVGDVLLSESGMRDHPLNPMHDANLVRVLQRQTPHRVERLDLEIARAGRAAIAAAIRGAAGSGARHLIVDASSDDDLRAIGEAATDAGLPLLCGASGIALGLPGALSEAARESGTGVAAALPAIAGPAAVLSGSCSVATRAQIAHVRDRWPTFDLNEGSWDDPRRRAADALAWSDRALGERPILIVASAEPPRVEENQRAYGVAEAGARVEGALATIARGLRDRGVTRFVVAGGETSGAVVAGLGIDALRIGPQIAPGVPWTATMDARPVALALKSGNFGGADFFVRALAIAP